MAQKFKRWLVAGVVAIGFGAIALPHVIPGQGTAVASPSMAPDFALPAVGSNKTLHLSDFKGKVRIVNFWATWCPPCRAEIPHFVSMFNDLKGKGVEIIGVSMDSNHGDVAPFIKEHHMTYPVVFGDEQVAEAYGGIRGIPTSFVIDRKGRIVKKYLGLPAQTEEGIKAAFMKDIKPLL